MPTMYAVASAKGGVGKTTTAANLAAALAAAGHVTVAVDGDIGTPDLAAALGVEVPNGGATLHDVLAGDADPVDATYEGPHGLGVVPGGRTLDAFRAADPSRLGDVLAAVTGAEYVVVDTGAGVTHGSALPLSLADGVVAVSTPTRDALSGARRTFELADRLGGTVAGVTLTRTDATGGGDVDPATLDAPVLGRVSEDPVVSAAAEAGEPLSTFAPGSDAAAAYRGVASALTGDPVPTPTGDDPRADGDAGASSDPSSDPEATAETAGDDATDAPAPKPPADATTPAVIRRVDADESRDGRTDGADRPNRDPGGSPSPRPLDGDATPAVTSAPSDDADATDGDADAVDAPRTVLGEVVDGDDFPETEADAGDGGAGRSGGFLGRFFR